MLKKKKKTAATVKILRVLEFLLMLPFYLTASRDENVLHGVKFVKEHFLFQVYDIFGAGSIV